ncbi:MAG: hypothetical protein KJ955_06535 [Nanoarchaeota archaeon]|nr:hypothetical protein [Nanoarchaeota archaeon]
MEPTCTQCSEITNLESRLDERAKALTEKVIEFCSPVRERNNERWKKFERSCNRRLVGRLTYEVFRTPEGMEDEPKYYDQDWYLQEGQDIVKNARLLESLKREDMGHWGEELMMPYLPGDPAGYYTPNHMITRKQCYDPKFCAETVKRMTGETTEPAETYLPEVLAKYDFGSLAGARKMLAGRLVLDSQTLKLAPEAECKWSAYAKLPNGVFSGPLAKWLNKRYGRGHVIYSRR